MRCRKAHLDRLGGKGVGGLGIVIAMNASICAAMIVCMLLDGCRRDFDRFIASLALNALAGHGRRQARQAGHGEHATAAACPQ
jgi:hypothetical protein